MSDTINIFLFPQQKREEFDRKTAPTQLEKKINIRFSSA